MSRFARAFVCALIFAATLSGVLSSRGAADNPSVGFLRTDGNRIVDADGRPVILTGVNWFGLETPNFAPYGLEERSWEDLLDQIVELGFNAIRLPYSNELFDPGSHPNGIDYDLNPSLEGLSGLEIMDRIIAGAGERGLVVILDRHRPGSQSQSELWYTPRFSEERWIEDWVMLARRYAGNETVVGVDLHNEPHGRATWGTGDPDTDWRLAAERAGNAILEVNPDLLIVVQGVDRYQGQWYWWGGSLAGVRDYPVRLNVPDRLVYSTHDYGPGVYPQPWFWEPDFPQNLEALWNHHWAFIHHEEIAPVLVGEFGGRSVGNDAEGIWQRRLVDFLRRHQISYTYWSLNPNSGDTGGLLLDDWRTVHDGKVAMLAAHQFPLLRQLEPQAPRNHPTVDPGAIDPAALEIMVGKSNSTDPANQNAFEIVILNTGPTAIPFRQLEIRAWLAEPLEHEIEFECLWAALGCRNLDAVAEEGEGGLTMVRIRFRPGAGILEAGGNSGVIKSEIGRPAVEWDALALYVDGRMVWGQEPASESAETTEGNDGPPVEQQAEAVTTIPAATRNGAMIKAGAILIGSALVLGALMAGFVLMATAGRR